MFRNVESFTALLDNVEHKTDISLEALLKSEAINEKFDAKGFFLIHAAIAKSNIPLIKQLFDNKADLTVKTKVTAENKEELRPLELAVKLNQPHIIALLLQAGADPTVKNLNNHAPMEEAIIIKHWDCVKQLAQSDKNTPELLGLSLLRAVLCKENDCAVFLINNKGPNVSIAWSEKDGYNALHVAIKHKNLPLIKILLEHKVDPSIKTVITKENSLEITPLEIAIQQEMPQPKIIDWLLEERADLSVKDSEGKTPIVQAAARNHWDCVKKLIPHVQDSAQLGGALLRAISEKEADCVDLLLAAKASLESFGYTKTGFFPLHIAIHQGSIDLVAKLLEAKADPLQKTDYVKDRKIKTAFQMALESEKKEIRVLFYEKFSNITSLIENQLVNPSSFMEEYDNLKEILKNCSFKKIMSLSKDYTALTSLFTLAYLMLFLKDAGNKKFKFLKNFHSLFRDIPNDAHVFVADAILSILKTSFESSSFNADTKKEIRAVFKASPIEEKKLYDNNHYKLKLLKEYYCQELRDEIYKNKISARLKIKIYKIAALAYIQKTIAKGECDFNNLKETAILFFGKDILDYEWFKGYFLISKDAEQLIKAIQLSNSSASLMARMPSFNVIPTAPPAPVALSSHAQIYQRVYPTIGEQQVEGQNPLNISSEQRLVAEVAPISLATEVTPISLATEVTPISLAAEVTPISLAAEVTPISMYRKNEPLKESEEEPILSKKVLMLA